MLFRSLKLTVDRQFTSRKVVFSRYELLKNLRWSTEGKKYHPDFVVLGYYIDDFHRNSDAWRFDAPKPRFEIANGRLELSSDALPRMEDIDGNEKRILAELAPLLRTPRVWTALEFALARVASVRRGHHEPAESFENKATLTTALIAETQRSCREVGARLAVVFFCPDRDDSDEARIRAVLESACQVCGVPFSSLPRHLGAKPDGAPSAAVFSKLNGHWTAHGHRLAAAEIVAFLRAQGFAN